MPRPLRIDFPGAIQHVSTRGVARGPIYLSTSDRNAFLAMLGTTVIRHGWIVYAYCLMNNHYHLLIRTPEANLASGMQLLNGNHAQRFNQLRERTGHLFQGRYASSLVRTESHLLEAIRYVVLNPVRAGLCRAPEQWRWSSYRGSAGLEPALPLLGTEALLELFARHPEIARRHFRDFVHDAIESVRDDVGGL